MQKIDLAVWPRAELFRFFSAVSQPFYSVTFRVDVTNLHAYARAHGVSFYYALGYLVTDAVNAVENFRYTIRSGEVWLLDERVPSFTDLKPGSQQFHNRHAAEGGRSGQLLPHHPCQKRSPADLSGPERRVGRSDLFFLYTVVRPDRLHQRAGL